MSSVFLAKGLYVLTTVLTFAIHTTGQTLALQFPSPPGPHPVGTTVIELNTTTTPPHDLLLTLFYPTSSTTAPLAPAYPPATLSWLLSYVGLPSSLPVTITTNSHLNAPIQSTSHFPLLFFSTGYGSPRLLYTSLCETLASKGYIVTLIDHPSDAPFVEYPDGRILSQNVTGYDTYDGFIPVVNARVQDITSILDAFSNTSFTSKIPGVDKHDKFQTSKVGVLGHSLGGASSAATMLVDKRFIAGLNLDGAIIGPVTTAGLSKPFFIISNQYHNRTNDPTWKSFWNASRGWKREMSINGTLHGSFDDFAYLGGELVKEGILPVEAVSPTVGTIDGVRLGVIEETFIGAFFGKWLKGRRAGVLDGEDAGKWPEVEFS